MKLEEKNIKVYNYSPSSVTLTTNYRTYIFEGAIDGIPTLEYIPFKEIEYSNSKCRAFRNGTLEFDNSEREELYRALKIFDWENIIFYCKIHQLLTDRTKESAERIISVTELSVLERIRGYMLMLVNSGQDDVPVRVINLVKERFQELLAGRVRSNLLAESEPKVLPEVERIQAENNQIKEQMEQMKKQMEKLLESDSPEPENTPHPSPTSNTPSEKPKTNSRKPTTNSSKTK